MEKQRIISRRGVSASKCVCIRITGRVQGVFFRDAAMRRAKALGLAGFVRNEPDGSVHIEAEGDEEALRALLAWCRRGPPFASVDDVTAASGDRPLRFTDFVVA